MTVHKYSFVEEKSLHEVLPCLPPKTMGTVHLRRSHIKKLLAWTQVQNFS